MELASLLEAVLPMPTQEVRMRTLERPLRGNCASAPIDEGAYATGIVGVPGDQHIEIVRQTDQPPVEHAVRRTCQSQSVANDIRTVRLNRLNMRRRDLGPPGARNETCPLSYAIELATLIPLHLYRGVIRARILADL